MQADRKRQPQPAPETPRSTEPGLPQPGPAVPGTYRFTDWAAI